uniref:Tripartite motif-containing protein 16-like n=1 Tax=Erpetoichthys calabaricus TaxID=27687 RepID=A0A8C4RGU5_ERPCA
MHWEVFRSARPTLDDYSVGKTTAPRAPQPVPPYRPPARASQVCSCPQCRHTFTTRPELNRNTLLNEVIKKLKKTTIISAPSQNYAGPGDVECDFCTGKKFRAVKSCLTCMASYCRTHLQPHLEGDALKHHKLVDPDRNLKEKLCEKHQKSLEIFCKTDDSCICMMCVVTGHNGHKMVELETEREEKQVNMEENKKSFSALIWCIEEAHRKLTKRIKEQEKRESKKAEGVMEQLEKEIEELRRREAELKELSETKDHLHFLQVRATLHRESNQTGVCGTGDRLEINLKDISSLVFFSLLSDFYPLTPDTKTAHRVLRLSEGNKKVTHERTEAKYPDHPDRFDRWSQVLCREALTGTRCYWEVECSGDLMMIGVAYKGLTRKGDGGECGLGYNDKSWSLRWSDSQYSVRHNNKRTVISAPYSPRIGVYLDWPAGSLSFYSVSHTLTLLHRFNTSFTEPLYPGFLLHNYSIPSTGHLMSPQAQSPHYCLLWPL